MACKFFGLKQSTKHVRIAVTHLAGADLQVGLGTGCLAGGTPHQTKHMLATGHDLFLRTDHNQHILIRSSLDLHDLSNYCNVVK
jgi:hypothetical protein